MVDATGHRSNPLGDRLAEGSYRAAQKVGRGTEEFVHHVKGQEFPLHEPRIKHALGMGYMVSPTGADHMHNMHDTNNVLPPGVPTNQQPQGTDPTQWWFVKVPGPYYGKNYTIFGWLLPFIEQDNVFKLTTTSPGTVCAVRLLAEVLRARAVDHVPRLLGLALVGDVPLARRSALLINRAWAQEQGRA